MARREREKSEKIGVMRVHFIGLQKWFILLETLTIGHQLEFFFLLSERVVTRLILVYKYQSNTCGDHCALPHTILSELRADDIRRFALDGNMSEHLRGWQVLFLEQ